MHLFYNFESKVAYNIKEDVSQFLFKLFGRVNIFQIAKSLFSELMFR